MLSIFWMIFISKYARKPLVTSYGHLDSEAEENYELPITPKPI